MEYSPFVFFYWTYRKIGLVKRASCNSVLPSTVLKRAPLLLFSLFLCSCFWYCQPRCLWKGDFAFHKYCYCAPFRSEEKWFKKQLKNQEPDHHNLTTLVTRWSCMLAILFAMVWVVWETSLHGSRPSAQAKSLNTSGMFERPSVPPNILESLPPVFPLLHSILMKRFLGYRCLIASKSSSETCGNCFNTQVKNG